MSFPEGLHRFIDDTTRFLAPMPIATEWVLLALAALLIAFAPFGSSRLFTAARNAFRRLAARKRLAIAICGILPIVIRLSLLGLMPVPDPSIHDEFSHLLLGDTLVHGRLTNPTHPMWRHFESIHIIQRPTYNSMYPPGQGAFLGLGEALFHEPWAGVVLSVAIMFAAMCWMMQQWLPPAWAFFGTLLAIFKIGIFGFWINSYMGGAVPAIGGALLIGSLPALKRGHWRAAGGLLFGLGLVVLMNTRPFEGAILGAAAAIYVLPALARGFVKHRKPVLRVLVSAALILACGVAFTGYYNWRVTGNPARMPYQVNRDTYGWPENLILLPAKKVVLQHKVLQAMYQQELKQRERFSTPLNFVESLDVRLYDNWTFFFGPLLTAPLLLLPWIFRDRRTRPLVVFLCVIAAVNLVQMVLYPYHLGPVVPIMFAIVAQGIRHIYVSLSRLGRPRAVYLMLVLPLCAILIGAMKQAADYLYIPLAYWEHAAEPHQEPRADIEAWLSARARKQLVIVRYAASHPPNQEWVYNHADIDGSKIVWAREMDHASDARLLKYFSDREVWLVEADVWPQYLQRYSEAAAAPDESTLLSRETKQP